VPGAASFKRMLDGAPCPDARARRAHHEGRARLDLGNQLLGRDRANARRRGAARRCAALGWWGAAMELARASRREAPHASPYQRN